MTTADTPLPPALAELAADFHEVSESERTELLMELGDDLPDPPEGLSGAEGGMERVAECQSPIYLAVSVADPADDPDRSVRLFFDAPAEAPTTRGFAGILHEGLDGAPAADVLALPEDTPSRFGLDGLVSPLRLQGMAGMIARIKRQVLLRTQAVADEENR